MHKSSKCRHCFGVLGSNPDSSLVVSQSPININERSVVKGSAGDDGKEERDFISPFTFPSSPSHQCLMVSRNRSLTAYRIIRDVGDESVVKSSWSHTQLRGLIPIFQPTGTVFLIRQFPSRKSIFLDLQIFSSTFQIKRNSFLLRR